MKWLITLKKIVGSVREILRRSKPRANRIDLQKKPVHFYLQNYHIKPILLLNLSWTGMGLKLEGEQKSLIKGKLISGRLKVGDKLFEVMVEVIYVGGEVAGCKFLKIPDGFRAYLQRQFEAEYTAKKLFPVSSKHLKSNEPSGAVQCFYGGNTEELYIVSEANTVTHFHMIFMGIYIEGGVGRAVRGMQKDFVGLDGPNFQKELELDEGQLTENLSFELIQEAISFVFNVEDLDHRQTNQLSELLESHSVDLPLASKAS